VYIEQANGFLEKKKVVRKRPGTVGICAAIQNKYGIDAVPHILCGGFTKEDTENFLIDLDFLGIKNVMALRGDAVKSETYFKPEPKGNNFASDLVAQILEMNKGQYLDTPLEKNHTTDFCVGVAGYPEKHMEAPSLDNDIEKLKAKVAAGAKYVVTQMFYDNSKFFEFVAKCRKSGITVPIIPGLKPIATKRQLTNIPHRFHVDLPEALIKAVNNCKTDLEVREVGVEWCTAQSKELISSGAEVLHYYSMGKSTNIHKIASSVF
jgi:methylenetetrahydrofolate reductase (NADPH)